MNFDSCASMGVFLIIPVFFFCFILNTKLYTLYECWVYLIFVTERKLTNLQNSHCPFRFLFEDFRPHPRYSNVNYGAWHVYKALFGYSVVISRLACSEISLSINEKKFIEVREMVGHSKNWEMA